MLKNKKTYLIPILSFIIFIIIGAVLLNLPICNNIKIDFKEALYVSISGVTTAGFLKIPLGTQFNFWGQLVYAILMEIGALGFVVIVSYFWSIRNKKMKMSDMIVINDNMSNDSAASIKSHCIFVGKLMIIAQIIGAIFLSIRFIPLLGFFKGLWYGIFHAISAFSNTGVDLFGNSGITVFVKDFYMQFVLIVLMLSGSIGVFVLEDIIERKRFSKFKLQTKIVLVATIILLVVPTVLIYIFEDLSLMNGLFLSVSARSTGFSIVDISNLTVETQIILMILMFIGGSPASTGGGVKIVAVAVVFATIISTLRGKEETVMFWRKIPNSVVRMAFTIFTLFAILLFIAIMLFINFNPEVNMFDIVFNSVAIISNAGFIIIDPSLFNDVIMMVLMFIGRIGPLSLVLMFVNKDESEKFVGYPEENVIL